MKLAVLLLIAVSGLVQSQQVFLTTPPKVIHQTEPEYTKEALDAKIQGTITLSAVVDVDGVASEIRLVQTLGKGLDEKAVDCLKQWRFYPATSYGKAFPAQVTIEVHFRLPPENSK